MQNHLIFKWLSVVLFFFFLMWEWSKFSLLYSVEFFFSFSFLFHGQVDSLWPPLLLYLCPTSGHCCRKDHHIFLLHFLQFCVIYITKHTIRLKGTHILVLHLISLSDFWFYSEGDRLCNQFFHYFCNLFHPLYIWIYQFNRITFQRGLICIMNQKSLHLHKAEY